MLELRASVAWDDWGVIEEVQHAAAVAGENDLLLCALDGGGELGGVSLLELLTSLELCEYTFGGLTTAV